MTLSAPIQICLDHDLRLDRGQSQALKERECSPRLAQLISLLETARISAPHPWIELLREAVAASIGRSNKWIKFNFQEFPSPTWITSLVHHNTITDRIEMCCYETLSLHAVSDPISAFASELLNQIGDIFLVLDPDDQICFVNQAFRATTELGDADVYGLSLSALVRMSNLSQDSQTGLNSLCLRMQDLKRGLEAEIQFSNRTLIWRATPQALASEGRDQRRYLTLTARDITELRQRDSALIESSHMASLGHQAAGIAHEINNPLAILMSKAEVALSQVPKDSPARATLNQILETTERISRIVRGLKGLSRRTNDTSELLTHCFSSLLRSNLDYVSDRVARRSVEIRLEVPETSCLVRCDPIQIGQIIVNLIQNACDAIDLAQPPCAERVIWLSLVQVDEGQSWALRVRDSGPGVPREAWAQIMKPFFTTKPAGIGTGLGLSLSRSLAIANRGELVFNPEHSSSTFELKLPCSKAE